MSFLQSKETNPRPPLAGLAHLKHRRKREVGDKLGMKSAGLAGVSSGMGLDDGLLVCTLLLLI